MSPNQEQTGVGPEGLKIVSVDDHVIEPPTLWVDRLPAKHRGTGPRVDQMRGRKEWTGGEFAFQPDPEGSRMFDVWHYEDRLVPLLGVRLGSDEFLRAQAALNEEFPTPTRYEELRKGCYDAAARLVDMDINGVEASVCFPNHFVRFAGQVFMEAQDKALALLCVQAYNDWMIEDWSAGSGGRLVPVCIVPLWDPELAAREVYRTAARGSRSIAFTEMPTFLGLPSLHTDHWDPLFRACAETNTVVNLHIGSGSKQIGTSPDAPIHTMTALTFVTPAMSICDWLLSGMFQRHPGLKASFAECQIGWIPYLLERLDRTWRHTPNWGWGGSGQARDTLPEPPSHYFSENVLCCFFEDFHGIDVLEAVGTDSVAFETDYPHTDGTWPESARLATDMLKKLDPTSRRKVVRDNAIRFFDLDLERASAPSMSSTG
jgi:predicted TIM-barrel fold metal-dependent hydrolase